MMIRRGTRLLNSNELSITSSATRAQPCRYPCLHRRPLPQISARQFSISLPSLKRSKKQKRAGDLINTPLPAFPKTGNDPLDAHFDKIWREQFVPDHMPKKYRDVILKTTKQHLLKSVSAEGEGDAGPPKIVIDGQEVELQPIMNRVYHSGSDLSTATDLIKSGREYNLLIPLIEAMGYSKIHISEAQWLRFIRKCGFAGRPTIPWTAFAGYTCHRNDFVVSTRTFRELVRSFLPRYFFGRPGFFSISKQMDAYLKHYQIMKLQHKLPSHDIAMLGTQLYVCADHTQASLQRNRVATYFSKVDRRWVAALDEVMKRINPLKSDIEAISTHLDPNNGTLDAVASTTSNASNELGAMASQPHTSQISLEDSKNSDTQNNARKVDQLSILRDALGDYEPLLIGLETSLAIHKDKGDKKIYVLEDKEDKPSLDTLVPTIQQHIDFLKPAITRWKQLASKLDPNIALGVQIYKDAGAELTKKYGQRAEIEADEELKKEVGYFLKDRAPMAAFWYTRTTGTEEENKAENVGEEDKKQ